ncbi:MAG: hypothetical protein PUF37_05945 [Prevotellaceae bacterium]|nr:hypothetical protein [Prevotellaceae bacterium]
MERGLYSIDDNGSVTLYNQVPTYSDADSTKINGYRYEETDCKDPVWNQPSGTYTLTLYHTNTDNGYTNVYYTVSHPSYSFSAHGTNTQTADTDPGDITFGAKANVATGSSSTIVNGDEVLVTTAPIDLIFGDAKSVTTALRKVSIRENNSDSDDKVYNLQGQRVYKPTHGIFITGGKKIIR